MLPSSGGSGTETIARGKDWLHMPITEVSAPAARYEAARREHGPRLIAAVRSGARVLVHCKGGLGRAGTVAALMLVDLGMAPGDAIRAIREARSQNAIETTAQERYINTWA